MWPTSIATSPSGRSGALQARAPNWIPWIDRWENENIDKPQWAAWKLRICQFYLFIFIFFCFPQSAECTDGAIFSSQHIGFCVLYTVFYLIIWEPPNWQMEDDGWSSLWMAAVMPRAPGNSRTMRKLRAPQRLPEQQGRSQLVPYNHLFTCNLRVRGAVLE